MEDFFSLLSFGAKFSQNDKKRFNEIKDTGNDEERAINLKEKSLPKELDFFGNKEKSENSNKNSNKKRKAEEEDVEDESDDDNQIQLLSKRKNKAEGDSEEEEEQEDSDDVKIKEKGQKKTELNKLRKKHKIKITPEEDARPPISDFSELETEYKVKNYLVKNIERLGYKKPTAIQMQAIPVLMSGVDMISCAPTGSGKTASFLIPMLHVLKKPKKELRGLVIAPTRELAKQIHLELQELAKGKPFRTLFLTDSSTSAISNNQKCTYDVIVTTPLRLLKCLREKTLSASTVKFFVLDEIDKLFEMGFIQQIDEIIAFLSKECQKTFFSATVPQEVSKLADTVLRNPFKLTIQSGSLPKKTISQELVYAATEDGKLIYLKNLILKGFEPPVIIFVENKERAEDLFKELVFNNINVDFITSDRSKAQRDRVVENFRRGNIWVLISTDILGRGVDFKNVKLVINYDFPKTNEEYIHRVGRTGRAGNSGRSITLFTDQDVPFIRSIANIIVQSGSVLPDWIFHAKQPKNKEEDLKNKKSQKSKKFNNNKSKSKKRKTVSVPREPIIALSKEEKMEREKKMEEKKKQKQKQRKFQNIASKKVHSEKAGLTANKPNKKRKLKK